MNKDFSPPSSASLLGKKRYLIIVSIFCFIFLSLFVSYTTFFSAPQQQAEIENFTIPESSMQDHNTNILNDSHEVAELLKEKGFIRSVYGFKIAFSGLANIASRCVDCMQTGTYQISKSMTVFEIVRMFRKGPQFKWVTIPEGLRKEQIANLLGESLGWKEEVKNEWVTTYTALTLDYLEGVYFPDTYLIPVDEKPMQVAQRLQRNFEEKFAPFSQEALKQNIKWTTLVTLASIIQREAAGKADMPLISGILWNRLLQADMKLEVDATVQYVRDDIIHFGKPSGKYQSLNYLASGDWWKPIVPADKNLDSPFNTYMYKGLPPHPIANPGVEAIKAVLYPEATDCLYYLHDTSKTIHCAKTFAEHKENIEKYLR